MRATGLLMGSLLAACASKAATQDAATQDAAPCACLAGDVSLHVVFSEQCDLGMYDVVITIAGQIVSSWTLPCVTGGAYEQTWPVPWPTTVHDGDTVAISFRGVSDHSHGEGDLTVTAHTTQCQLVDLPVKCGIVADASFPDAAPPDAR